MGRQSCVKAKGHLCLSNLSNRERERGGGHGAQSLRKGVVSKLLLDFSNLFIACVRSLVSQLFRAA